jgi:Fur family transcriptional regulator, ferric uptake regulator
MKVCSLMFSIKKSVNLASICCITCIIAHNLLFSTLDLLQTICNNDLMDVILQLKNQGFRLTKPRIELLKVLVHRPLTVQEIYDLLIRRNIHVDLTSVYRTLELFVSLGAVSIVEFGEDKKRYELSDQDHHHHLVCTKCGLIEDVSLNENELLNKVKIQSKFKIDHHNLEFFGLCQNCQ